MKKILMLGLLLCVCLSGCAFSAEEESTLQNSILDGSLDVDAVNRKAAYYQQLAAELEGELLALETQLYEERVRYELQIEALESALNATDAEKDFHYSITDGKATLLSYVGSAASVALPATYNGCPVVAIADRAFENNLRLTSVIIPEGVQSIGWFAFSGCIALASVTLPTSLSVVQYGAFQNCPSSMTVSCPPHSYAHAYAESYGMAIVLQQ